jgi:hypothetical protein
MVLICVYVLTSAEASPVVAHTLDAADVPDSGIYGQHPRLLQRQGKFKNFCKKWCPRRGSNARHPD